MWESLCQYLYSLFTYLKAIGNFCSVFDANCSSLLLLGLWTYLCKLCNTSSPTVLLLYKNLCLVLKCSFKPDKTDYIKIDWWLKKEMNYEIILVPDQTGVASKVLKKYTLQVYQDTSTKFLVHFYSVYFTSDSCN